LMGRCNFKMRSLEIPAYTISCETRYHPLIEAAQQTTWAQYVQASRSQNH